MNIRQRFGLGLMIIASSWYSITNGVHKGEEFDVFGVPAIVLCILGQFIGFALLTFPE